MQREILNVVVEIADDARVKTFTVGRTNDLDARKSAKEADVIVPVYETRSIPDCMKAEEDLLTKIRGHEKCQNEATDSRGNINEGDLQHIYVAIMETSWVERMKPLG